MFVIKTLSPEDVLSWKKIRLEGLLESPQAFGESYAVESNKSDAEHSDQLTKSTIFACYGDKNEILGVLGFYVNSVTNARHRGNLFCMYVRPEQRWKGIGGQLIDQAIDYAKTKVQQLHLTVVTNNNAAVELYKKRGFTIYGTEPRALLLANTYFDEYLMVKILQ